MDRGPRSGNEFDQFFGQAHPNPERVGCLPAGELRALARRERPIDDPGYAHLEQCSPCYQQFRGFQHERRGLTATRWFFPAAAVLATVMTGASIYYFSQQASKGPTNGSVQQQAGTSRALLDLRPFIVTRGEEQAGRVQPLRLSRGDRTLDILLPVGFEPGSYELRLVNENLQTMASKLVVAAVENQVATIHTTVDLGGIPPGQYQLAIRVPGEEWHLYPARVD